MRRRVRPYGQSIPASRVFSLLLAAVVLLMIYDRMADPRVWQFLVEERNQDVAGAGLLQQAGPATTSEAKPVVPAAPPFQLSEALRRKLFIVEDRAALVPREMPAYWALMEFVLGHPTSELKRQALKDVPFTQLWEQPEKYRGKPIALRLHVRRVIQYDAPDNPLGLTNAYEAWGWTDESRSFPYVVVFPNKPPGLPVGTDIRADIDFTGCFLKVMAYTAFDNQRGAPLLVGHARLVPKAGAPKAAAPFSSLFGIVVLIGLVACGLVFSRYYLTRQVRPQSLVTSDPLTADWSLTALGTQGGTATPGIPASLLDDLTVPTSDSERTTATDFTAVSSDSAGASHPTVPAGPVDSSSPVSNSASANPVSDNPV